MRRLVILASLIAIGASAALAQSAAIGQRKDIFKSFGAASGVMGKMLRGEDAFDLAKVQNALGVYVEKAKVVAGLFPADSKDGGETKALPEIWSDNAKFLAIFANLEADAKAAQAAIKDEASFKAEAPKVFANCVACHGKYRAK